MSTTRRATRTALLALAALSAAAPAVHAEIIVRPPPQSAPLTAPTVEPIRTVDLMYERPRRERHLTLIGELGALDRNTTGTLTGYGYDAAATPTVGVSAQLLFPVDGCHCATHGFDLGFTYSGGPTLGIAHEAAFRHHTFDLAYAWRWELPCMRRQNRRVYLTARLGLAGTWADAGLGDVSRDELAGTNQRMVAAARDDHFAVGWRLGGAMDMTIDSALLGFGVDLRELYGVNTDMARTFMLSANVRVGVDLGF